MLKGISMNVNDSLRQMTVFRDMNPFKWFIKKVALPVMCFVK